MASHHLVEDTFNAESEGPDIQAQDLCPSISLPTFLAPRRGVQLLPPRGAFALVVPTPARVNQENESRRGQRWHMPESRRKNRRALEVSVLSSPETARRTETSAPTRPAT